MHHVRMAQSPPTRSEAMDHEKPRCSQLYDLRCGRLPPLSLWPHGLASFSSKLPGLRSAWRCAVARRSLRSPTNCVVALQASSLRPPPPASLRSCLRGRLSSLRGALDLSRSQKDLGCSESSLPEAYAKHLITFFGDALLTRISVSRLISWPYAKFREPRIGELRQGELRRIPRMRTS